MISTARQIAIRDLVPDTQLGFDLITPDGVTILRKGQLLEKAIIDRWLALGFDKVLAASEESSSTQPLDPIVIEETTACTKAAAQQLGNLVETISAGSPSSLRDLSPVLQMIAKVTLSDRDAAWWSVEKDVDPAKTPDLQLAKRSARFSLMAYSTARTLNVEPEDCQAIALAALLHDVALYSLSLQSIRQSHPQGITNRLILQRHSLLGAELVAAMEGVSGLTRQAMLEVHEQVDGTGYPRGLRRDKLSLGGMLLNLIDAYLSLTAVDSPTGLIPADAIAYMIKQTADGAFDRGCMQALLKVVSAFGIGSQVTLDDNSQAVVIRSSETDALRPIVRLDDEHSTVVDLRHSRLAIKEARLSQADPRKRIKRSAMDSVLWQPAYLAD